MIEIVRSRFKNLASRYMFTFEAEGEFFDDRDEGYESLRRDLLEKMELLGDIVREHARALKRQSDQDNNQ